LQELALGRLTLAACPPMAGETHHRWPRLATPAHKYCAAAAAALLLCRAAAAIVLLSFVQGGGPGPERELTGTAAILLRTSATRSSLITILLLQPVFFLRPWARRKLKTGTGTVMVSETLG